jgi:hypothetical protein
MGFTEKILRGPAERTPGPADISTHPFSQQKKNLRISMIGDPYTTPVVMNFMSMRILSRSLF